VDSLATQERRAAPRYPIVAPLAWEHGEGVSENLSTSGIYVVAEQRLAPGEPVRLTMTLPWHGIPVTGHGVVVRVEPRDGRYGVAVRLDSLMPVPDLRP